MVRSKPVVVLAAAVAATAAALSGLAGAAHAGTTASTTAKACRGWTGQHPPYAIWLTGVVALSPCDVWATGVPGVNTQSATVTDLLHWNGVTWTLRTSDTVPASLSPLPSVTATSASDAWVAGSVPVDVNPQGIGNPGTLVAHWNGAALNRVPSPDPGAPQGVDTLSGVSATAVGNVWAAGLYSVFDPSDDSSKAFPLAEHWNGHAWAWVPAATPQTYGHPSPYAAFSAVEAHCGCGTWAVGDYSALTSATSNGYRTVTLTERWESGAWHVVASPNLSGGYNQLTAVSADSKNDAWAVGSHSGSTGQTLAEHWNGHAWKVEPSPNPGRVGGKPDGSLSGVAAISPRDAWAVGSYDSPAGKEQALLLHWNGTSWRQVALPHFGPKGEPNVLNSVSASPAGYVVVAGFYSGHAGAGQQALLFRVP